MKVTHTSATMNASKPSTKLGGISTLKIIGLVAAVLVLIVSGIAAWVSTPGLREPVRVPQPDYWPTNGWRSSTPEEQGYSSEKLAEGLQDIQEKGIAIDSLLIIHNGYVVLDAHFAPYDGTFPHNLASVTKSVMTTLIGIAADQGKLDLDQPMVSFFPDRTIANLDERKARMTVRHLATMTNGMQSGCMADDLGTIAAMRAKPDWMQAALDRPMIAEPGTEFCYDSPGMHILSAILQESTGMTALEFAQQNLFGPLGIQDAIWDVDPQGYNQGGGDLHLTPESAAKIGYLWLHQGNWNGQQIVSRDWVLDSIRRHSTKVDHDSGYGYGWWINMSHYFAAGRLGQSIRVIPALNTVLVTTGGGFDEAEIEGFLFPMLLQSSRPRPASPEGQAALQATLASIQKNESIPAGLSTSEIARVVSGRMYECENNPAGLESLRIDFDDPTVAMVYQKLFSQELVWEVGMDGHYRQSSPDGDALIGYWEDASTFHLEIFDLGTQVYQVKFQGDRLQVISNEADLTIACQAQTP
jgi:CubicO group peptidase (beta-lactamase class C family)